MNNTSLEGGAKENKENGKNVTIVVKMLRHGERDKETRLTDYGRQVTREKAQRLGYSPEAFDAVKPVGSNVGPKGLTRFGRALETAEIYAGEIAGDEAFNTRLQEVLNYTTFKTKAPYNHVEIYNSHLHADFDSLTDIEKSKAAKKAQTATLSHLLSLNSPEAEAYRREVAWAYAYVVDHYMRMAHRLHSGSRVLIPAGGHGGHMELLLQQALVRKEGDHEISGFSDLSEIGGDIDPSEAFNVTIATDEEGKMGPLMVKFDELTRPQIGMHLDPVRIKELRDYYVSLHEE